MSTFFSMPQRILARAFARDIMGARRYSRRSCSAATGVDTDLPVATAQHNVATFFQGSQEFSAAVRSYAAAVTGNAAGDCASPRSVVRD